MEQQLSHHRPDYPPPERSVRAAQSSLVASLHRALDELCSGPLATSAGVGKAAGADEALIDALVAHCSRQVARAATDEAGGDLCMDEANAAVRSRLGEAWSVVLSRQNGAPYYHNAATGATAWERPDSLAADRLGLELDPAVLAQNHCFYPAAPSRARPLDDDGLGSRPPVEVSFLAHVRAELAKLPPHSDRVDLARVVSRGLAEVAEAVDAAAVARASAQQQPARVGPYAAAAAACVAACGALVREPEVAWLLQDPASEVQAEVAQLKSLLALATATAGAGPASFAHPRRGLYGDSPSGGDDDSSSSGGGPAAASGGSDKPREISRMCRHILASSAEGAPASLPTARQKSVAAASARQRLQAIHRTVVADAAPAVASAAAGYDPRALQHDLAKVAAAEENLRQQHASSLQRVRREKDAALALADGYGARSRAVDDLLSFALAFSVRNRRCCERAQHAVASAVAQEQLLQARFEDDTSALAAMATALARDRREARLVDAAAAALDTWRSGVFARLDQTLAAHGSEAALAADHGEYTRALQRHSVALQQLREELGRLAADVASGVPALQERLLEVDTRLALAAWHDGGDLGAASGLGATGGGLGGGLDGGQGYGGLGGGVGYGVGVAREQSQGLHGVRAAVQAALHARSLCLADLGAVAEAMDARLAQRVWAPTTGLAAQAHEQRPPHPPHPHNLQPPPSSPPQQAQQALVFSPVAPTRGLPHRTASAGGRPAQATTR